jgi:hypothetical protein
MDRKISGITLPIGIEMSCPVIWLSRTAKKSRRTKIAVKCRIA